MVWRVGSRRGRKLERTKRERESEKKEKKISESVRMDGDGCCFYGNGKVEWTREKNGV